MVLFGSWAIAVGLADLIAPTEVDTNDTRRAWLATLALPVAAATVGVGIGLPFGKAMLLTLAVAVSGWTWLWSWRLGAPRVALTIFGLSFSSSL